MFKIHEAKWLAPNVKRFIVHAPRVADHHKPGHFVILRVSDDGERIPLTIAGADPKKGTISLIWQQVGKTTTELANLNVGDSIANVCGPLGTPTHIENFGMVVCVGGGIGVAPLYPIAKALKQAGNHITTIIGARSQDLMSLTASRRSRIPA